MPLPKRPQIPSKDNASTSKSKDSRFADFQTNPLYRLPSKKHTKTKLDDRFSRLLTDPDFYNKASVDKYGRKKDKNEGKKGLEKFYRLDEGASDEVPQVEPEKARKRDQAVQKELTRVDIRGNALREGDVSSSSDESSSDEEEEEEDVLVEDETEMPAEGSEVPMGDVTSRLAAVNMDWDNIRAMDIMGVAGSFVPTGGRILSVVIYPSEFGMERLQREELEGPPREIFASGSAKDKEDVTTIDDASEVDEDQIQKELREEGGAEDFDSKALRKYQLDRLRYYYAVITCSSPDVAKALYDNMDGREYLSSANFFDLRFVPDETTFDEDPHDECEKLPEGYKPNEFKTDALTHSKVKLTWDAEDTTRKEVQKRAFSRKEIDENELQAYLGSDSDEEVEDDQPDKAAAFRAALGLDASQGTSKSKPASSKRDRDFKKPDGEMQVTFSAGLSSNGPGGSVFENEPIEETTIEKYVRKQRERKQRRKENMKAAKQGEDTAATQEEALKSATADAGEDDPWNDPFFADDGPSNKPSASSLKASKAKKREEREKAEKQQAEERANLELLMVDDDNNSKVQHFDMNEILKAEKQRKKKGGKKHKKQTADDTSADQLDDFQVNTTDPRFAKLYDSHEFAIDPTNPRFQGTQGMKALLEEGRKKRKRELDAAEEVGQISKKKEKVKDDGGETEDLKKLAARVKAKSRKA